MKIKVKKYDQFYFNKGKALEDEFSVCIAGLVYFGLIPANQEYQPQELMLHVAKKNPKKKGYKKFTLKQMLLSGRYMVNAGTEDNLVFTHASSAVLSKLLRGYKDKNKTITLWLKVLSNEN